MSKKERIALVIIIFAIASITVFFGIRKVNYHIDEVWNYGLANSMDGIIPNIEYGKVYKGDGVFAKYMQVPKDDRFNYVNVWKNQADDVHPPLSYVLLHTVCSIFADSYSKWYGIGINMVWMVLILVVLYKLSKDVLGSKLGALGVVSTYGTTVLFFDTIIFIRMYAQFTFFAILLAYLMKQYWDAKLTKKFYLSAGALLIVGVLTHYYFMIFAFFLCLGFVINLILNKRYIEARNSIICFVSAGILYILIWYHILGHLFRGYRGKEAIEKAVSFKGLFNGFFSLIEVLDLNAFSGTILLFAVLGIIAFVKKLKSKERLFGYNLCLFLVAVMYLLVVGKIAPYMDERYIMNVGFIYVIAAFIVAKKTFGTKFDTTRVYVAFIGIFLILNFVNVAIRGFCIPKDGYTEDFANTIDLVQDNRVVVYVKDEWSIIGFFEPLRNSKSYVFVNDDDIEDVIEQQEDEFVLLTYGEGPEELTEKYNCKFVNRCREGYYYLVTNSKS